ncbi:MAG: SAM-dependent methyltransferase [Candidatus Peregrinibacteria bacterium Greene0416_19]|nr:MAG: SAM-dependent methyltransferase [Candidatus Peregrinibacteria bacterium Greene0416_19]
MQTPQFDVHAACEEHHWWFLGRRAILDALLHELLPPSSVRDYDVKSRGDHVALRESRLLIDVGCGTGGVTAYLSREYRVIGVEPTEDGFNRARGRFPHCTFVHGYAPKDVAEDFAKADGILLIEVLEHIENDVAFVHELIEHMKPGAFLIMMAPADMSLWSPHDVAFEHYRRYEPDTFRKLWTGTPVEELLMSHCMSRLYPLAKVQRMINRIKGSSSGEGGTDVTMPPAPINAILKTIYAGEAKRLVKVLQRKAKPYRKGVTTVAVLRKNG